MRNHQPHQSPLRPRAIAISRTAHDERVLMLIHLLCAATLPFLLLLLTGCGDDYKGEKVEYGPEVSSDAINDALAAPLTDIDPATLKLGEYVHFSLSQSINNDPVPMILKDTSRTVTSLSQSSTAIEANIIQHEVTYQNDGTYSKVSREFPVTIELGPTLTPLIASPRSSGTRNVATVQAVVASLPSKVRTFEGRRTYHRLQTSVEESLPPSAVQKREDCAGIPKCRIRVHKVSFDLVDWTGDRGERTTVEVALSPDVPVMATPYFDLFYNQCVTQSVLVNAEASQRVFVKQCTTVEDFRFQADPTVAP